MRMRDMRAAVSFTDPCWGSWWTGARNRPLLSFNRGKTLHHTSYLYNTLLSYSVRICLAVSLFSCVSGLNSTKGKCWRSVKWNRKWYTRSWGGKKLCRIGTWKWAKHSCWLVCFLSSDLFILMISLWVDLLPVSTVFLCPLGGRRRLHKGAGGLGPSFSPHFRCRSQRWWGQHG